MDPLTHGLSGALLARATWSARDAARGLGAAERTAVGFAAALFPDIDYVVFWVDPLRYINVHQGWTHSLVLMPVWALLLAPLLAHAVARWTGRLRKWRAYYGICVLGIGAHIGGDVITAYGTELWAPLSGMRLAWPIAFVIDPYFCAILIAGLWGAFRFRSARPARWGLLGLGAYLCVQALCWYQALGLARHHAERRNQEAAEVQAFAQPFSPFNWKLIAEHEEGIDETHVRLLRYDPLARLNPGRIAFPETAAAYLPLGEERWSHYARLDTDADVDEAWSQDAFSDFRRFAVFPVLYRVDRYAGSRCVWFTDLRYTLPVLLPSFRFGMCRESEGVPWRLYRLRIFTEGDRQALER